MKILHLNLKKKWFDMITSGEKKDEYREFKRYWVKRLVKSHTPTVFKHYDVVKFRNGYSKDSPTVSVECLGIEINNGNKDWGWNGKPGFVIKLGKILTD